MNTSLLSILIANWFERPLRFFITLLGLALSATTLVGIIVASHNARASYQALNKTISGIPAIDVFATDGERFDETLLSGFDYPTEIADAIPMLFRGSTVRFEEQRLRGLILGIPLQPREQNDLRDAFAVSKYLPFRTKKSFAEDSCLISSTTAEQLKVVEGDSIQCLFKRSFQKLNIRQIIPSREWQAFANEPGIIVDLGFLQKVSGVGAKVDRVRLFVKAEYEYDKSRIERELGSRIPSAIQARPRSGSLGLADDILRSAEMGLVFSTALALMMASFILLNTTRINLAERRRSFAILRCIGASTSQITKALMFEMAITASIASGIGVVSGCLLGWLLSTAMSKFAESPLTTYSIPWLPLIVVGAAVPIVAIGVVLVAIRGQKKILPLENFREPAVDETNGLPWRNIYIGLAFWAISLVGLVAVGQEKISPFWGIPAGIATLVGYLLFMPVGLIPFLRCIGWFAEKRKWFLLDFSRFQLVRQPERTSLNAGFLVIALCGAIGLGQSLLSNLEELTRWYEKAFPGDLFLVSTQTPSQVNDSEEPVRAFLASEQGLVWADPIRFFVGQAEGQSVTCIIRELPEGIPFPGIPQGLTDQEASETLRSGKVLLSSMLAKRLLKRTGDSITLMHEGRQHLLEVGGTYADFTNGGMSILMLRKKSQQQFVVTGFNLYAISVKPEETQRIRDSLIAIGDANGFVVRSGEELRKWIDQSIQGVLIGVWSVILMSFATGGFGIATTLAMNVIEQTRDFALLRLVGMSRRQVVLTVMFQAWILGLIGIVFGVIAALSTSMIIYFCSDALLGYTPVFKSNGLLVVVSVIGTVLVVSVAAWLPAYRATTIDPKEELLFD